MKSSSISTATAFALSFVIAPAASALSVPYTETFAGGTANWSEADFSAPSLVNSGGADGSEYVTLQTDIDLEPAGTQVLFRCHASAACSAGAFVGNWEDNVGQLSFAIRHDSPTALNLFVRIATAGNFPAWNAVAPVAVAGGTWTTLSFDIFDGSPLLSPEFGSFSATFVNVGNLQIGLSEPLGLSASNITFDLDQISLSPVPVPAALWLLTSGVVGLILRQRQRKH